MAAGGPHGDGRTADGTMEIRDWVEGQRTHMNSGCVGLGFGESTVAH